MGLVFGLLLLDLSFHLLNLSKVGGVRFGGFQRVPIGVEFFITLVSDAFHIVMTHRTGIFQNVLVVELQHSFHVGAPEIESQVFVLPHAQIRLFKKDDNEAIENVEFLLCEVVFGDDNIALSHP